MTKKKQFLRSLMVRGFVLTIPLMVFGFFAERPLVLAQDAKELLKRVDRLYRSDSSHAEMEMEVITENWERTMRMEVYGRHPPSGRSLKIFRVGKCSAWSVNQSLLTESFGLFTLRKKHPKTRWDGYGGPHYKPKRTVHGTLTRSACKPSG